MGNNSATALNEGTGKVKGRKGAISAKWHQQHRNWDAYDLHILGLFSTRSSTGQISAFQREYNQFTNGIQSH